jgi:hypothetical protein
MRVYYRSLRMAAALVAVVWSLSGGEVLAVAEPMVWWPCETTDTNNNAISYVTPYTAPQSLAAYYSPSDAMLWRDGSDADLLPGETYALLVGSTTSTRIQLYETWKINMGSGDELIFTNKTIAEGTIEFWVRLPGEHTPETGTSLGFLEMNLNPNAMGEVAYLQLGADHKMKINCWPEGAASAITVVSDAALPNWAAGEWHHIALSWGNNAERPGIRMYADSREAGVNATETGAIFTAVGRSLYIGGGLTGTGLIDRIRLHNTALPREELDYFTFHPPGTLFIVR